MHLFTYLKPILTLQLDVVVIVYIPLAFYHCLNFIWTIINLNVWKYNEIYISIDNSQNMSQFNYKMFSIIHQGLY